MQKAIAMGRCDSENHLFAMIPYADKNIGEEDAARNVPKSKT